MEYLVSERLYLITKLFDDFRLASADLRQLAWRFATYHPSDPISGVNRRFPSELNLLSR